MGVDISSLVKATTVNLPDLADRAIAIDAFNTLYQFITTIRQRDGTPLTDREGRVTSHLSGLFHRTATLLELRMRPVFVFDGKPPQLKKKTIEARREARDRAKVEWEKALEAGDVKRAQVKASQSSRLDDVMISESRALLEAMGVPWIAAPSEGEAQMAHMARTGDVYAGASQDYDALLFGTPTLVRNLTLSRKRRVAGGRLVDVSPEMVRLEEVLSAIGLTAQQLVDLAILVGTDFNDGVHGIGPKRALKLMKEHGSLEEVSAKTEVHVPGGFEEVRAVFLEPDVTSEYELRWGAVDAETVRRLLCDEHGFSVDRVDSVVKRMGPQAATKRQSSLDSWG